MGSRAGPGERIEFGDFLKVDVRVGTVVACDPFPEARTPAYKLTIDFGPDIGVKRASAQVTDLYRREDLADSIPAVVFSSS